MTPIENVNLLIDLLNRKVTYVNKTPNNYLIESNGNKFFIPYGRTLVKSAKTIR